MRDHSKGLSFVKKIVSLNHYLNSLLFNMIFLPKPTEFGFNIEKKDPSYS
jgi:hypothetical protein